MTEENTIRLEESHVIGSLLELAPITILKQEPVLGIAPHISSQFPEFVREDHEKFVEFITLYYQWLESHNNVLYDSHRIRDYQDIDTTIDEFTEQFFREFLPQIPRFILADKASLLKNVKQFYRAKGTEKSFELFFRILYNTSIEFYYPRKDILRVSDGKWIQDTTIRITTVSGDVTKFASHRIQGLSKNATAFVERVVAINEGPIVGYELFLNRSSITGEFLPEETIECVYEDKNSFTGEILVKTVRATISAVPIKVIIKQAGQGYQANQVFQITRFGSGAKLRIEKVDSLGAIQEISIYRHGLGYRLEHPLDNIALTENLLTTSNIEDVAIIDVPLGAQITYPGFYATEDGQLSTTKYIHDGEYYQQFSYVVFVNESLSLYKDNLNKLIHPVGLKLFGGFRSQEKLIATAKTNRRAGDIARIIQSKLSASATKIHTHVNVLYDSTKDKNAYPLGPTYDSVCKNAFKHKPFFKYDANSEVSGTQNYFGQFGKLDQQTSNMPIFVFDEIKNDALLSGPGKLEQSFSKQTNILPDAVVINKTEDEYED